MYVTRQDDTFVSLQSRVSTSHYRNADAFISIHYDSYADTSTRGKTAYYYSPAKDQELASDVHSEVVKRSSIPDRGVLFEIILCSGKTGDLLCCMSWDM